MTATRIVVADRTRARLLEANQQGPLLELEERELLADDTPRKKNHDLVTDAFGERHGGAFRTGSDTGSADYHREAAETFAREIARHLEAEANRNEFDRLVLCAEPRFLGFLRGALATRVGNLVVGEVHKDLARAPLEDIRGHVLAALAPQGRA
jgi:protein required for attachment to host cells